MSFRKHLIALALLGALCGPALAQGLQPFTAGPTPTRAFVPPRASQPGNSILMLGATITGMGPARSGLQWRIFPELAEADGTRALAAESQLPTPMIELPDGSYIVHVSYGLASGTKRVTLSGSTVAEQISINAGGLRIAANLGDVPIAPNKLSIAIYVPERGSTDAKLVVPNARLDGVVLLPEGNYRIVSTYLDLAAGGSTGVAGMPPNATNSVINAEVSIKSGKLTDVVLRHRAALMTLKLVNTAGGEALAR